MKTPHNLSKYQKSNVMTPLNWCVGLTESALMAGIIGSDDLFVKITCLVIVVAVLLFYGYVYLYFMKSAPDKLQTEEYNLRNSELSYKYGPAQEVKAEAPLVIDVVEYNESNNP